MSMTDVPGPLGEEEKQMEVLKSETIKVDFPYNLNTLFNLNYSFDTLKKSIEYLAR